MLIKRSRSASEVGISTADWHTEIYDEAPDGYASALKEGVEFVEVVAGSTALKLVADADPDEPPRYCMRLEPRTTLGLGLILSKGITREWCVLGPLKKSLKRLKVGECETLLLHSSSGSGFPAWVYDGAAEAYREGYCTKIGVSTKNLNSRSLKTAYEALQKRGIALSCCFVELSLLNRKTMALVEECKSLGVQVYAREALGRDELASGRFTAANPTGGDISIPRFTLAQLILLAPVHEALASVAQRARARTEKQVDTTQVALQWVRAKGASPVCEIDSEVTAKALPACKGWSLTEPEVEQLDKAAEEVEKGRRWK